MKYLRKLYGTTKIDSSDSQELDENESIELEYYETKNDFILLEDSKPYGIEIVKKKKEDEEVKIENKVINNIYYEERETSRLLDILIHGKVTPVSVEDIIEDLGVSLG